MYLHVLLYVERIREFSSDNSATEDIQFWNNLNSKYIDDSATHPSVAKAVTRLYLIPSSWTELHHCAMSNCCQSWCPPPAVPSTLLIRRATARFAWPFAYYPMYEHNIHVTVYKHTYPYVLASYRMNSPSRLSVSFSSASHMTSSLFSKINEEVKCFDYVVVVKVDRSQGSRSPRAHQLLMRLHVNIEKKVLRLCPNETRRS
jgi:hypothetical protein